MKYIAIVISIFTLISCAKESENGDSIQNNHKTSEFSDALPKLDVIVDEIEKFREGIEENLGKLQKHEILLDSARSQVRQKWSKMHVYIKNDEIVRIKMYPHEGISLRTEEFYYSDEKIRFVYIEDKGLTAKDDHNEEEGRSFWFKNGKLIKTEDYSDDTRPIDKDSYQERLLSESKEYLEIARKHVSN